MQNNIQAQIESLKDSWISIKSIPEDLSSVAFQGFTRQNVTDSLESIVSLLDAINSDPDFEPDTLSLASIQTRINTLNQYVNSNLPNNPLAHLPVFIQQLELLRDGIQTWGDLAETRKLRVSRNLIQRLADATAKVTEAESTNAEIAELKNKLLEASEEIESIFKTVTEGNATFTSSLAEALLKSSEINTLQQKSTTESEKLDKLVESFTDLKVEVEEARADQESLFEKFEQYEQEIRLTLGDANRVGMAGAFIDRRDKYDEPINNWNRIFVGSIVILILMAIWVVAPYLSSGNWKDILIRLPLTAPAVWLAWFASKQFGYMSRLKEDYAYKAAAAMAFEGYKKEAKEAGEDMETKLLETAIGHLNENPIRIYDTKNHHNSPLSELLEEKLKSKDFGSQLIELIKAIKG